MEVNTHEAKSQLSRLIERAMLGEDVVIAKAGHPMVRLIRIDLGKPLLGATTGRFVLPEGWDSPLADEEVKELFGQ